MFKKIVVPLDGSKVAECVLPHIESIAKGFGAEETILVTVTERAMGLVQKDGHGAQLGSYETHQPSVAYADRPYSGRQFVLEPSMKIPLVTGKILKQGQKYLSKIAEQLAKKGVKVSITVLMGDAAEQIVDFAGSEKADLIIMASHGRSGISRWAMGSVAEKVFRGTRIPILLVKATKEEIAKQ